MSCSASGAADAHALQRRRIRRSLRSSTPKPTTGTDRRQQMQKHALVFVGPPLVGVEATGMTAALQRSQRSRCGACGSNEANGEMNASVENDTGRASGGASSTANVGLVNGGEATPGHRCSGASAVERTLFQPSADGHVSTGCAACWESFAAGIACVGEGTGGGGYGPSGPSPCEPLSAEPRSTRHAAFLVRAMDVVRRNSCNCRETRNAGHHSGITDRSYQFVTS
jgi:hypothetical protein